MIPMGSADQQMTDPNERVLELTWALVDDHLEEAAWNELQKSLVDSAAARQAYIQAMQLHTDLLFHYKDQRPADSTQGTPSILGCLGDSTAMTFPTLEVGS